VIFRDLQQQEAKIRLITRFELAAKNESDLRGLLRNIFNELARSESYTIERINALASIYNIQREIISRAPQPLRSLVKLK